MKQENYEDNIDDGDDHKLKAEKKIRENKAIKKKKIKKGEGETRTIHLIY